MIKPRIRVLSDGGVILINAPLVQSRVDAVINMWISAITGRRSTLSRMNRVDFPLIIYY